MAEVSFYLNNEKVSASYEEGMTLLEVLRDSLGLTSVKDGCSAEGYCGACTILLEGKPVLSCKQKPENIEGKKIITLEGIPDREKQILARAFVREGAVQCGFCTPGFVIKAKSLIDKGMAKDRQAIAKALNSHLCRCTGYQRIFDAVETARDVMDTGDQGKTSLKRPFQIQPRLKDETGKKVIGENLDRFRGVEMALGQKPYIADLQEKEMLFASPVLVRKPRVRITAIDKTGALSCQGVKAVITAKDVPGQRFIGPFVRDWPVFVDIGEEAKYVGDIVAFVVADTQFRARKASTMVKIEYEPLEPVTDPEKALLSASPAVHEGGNLLEVCAYKRGDLDTAFKNAKHIFQHRFNTQRIEHAFLETEACLAVPKVNGTLHVYSQGQGVHEDQKEIASVLGISKEKITVKLVSCGGGFGGKEDTLIQTQTALAARLLKSPVKTVLTRQESLLMHPKRHPLIMDYEIAADDQGFLLGARVRIIGDTGAYASVGMKVLERAAGHALGPYYLPAVDVVAKTVYTNNPPCGAMRGFGVNQTAFAMESLLDMVAEQVGIGPYEIREKNILRPGKPFGTGQIMNESCKGLERCLLAVKNAFINSKTPAGLALGIKNMGIGNGLQDIGRVKIKILHDRTLEISTGYTEMGQGLFTVLIQVVSEITGLDPTKMSAMTISDPDVLCGMTTASRATALTSMAAKFAAEKLKSALQEKTLEDLIGKDFLGEYICDFTSKPGAKVDNPITHLGFSYAAQVVILDNQGKVKKVIAAQDVGRAINPLGCVGQIEGSVHMGLGYALSESFDCEGGQPKSLKMRDLGIVSAAKTPEMEVILIEEPDPNGGFGSKGAGEINIVPTAGAVANALYRFDGKRRFALPLNGANNL